MTRIAQRFAGFVAALLIAGPAIANEPKPWQLGFQPAASPNMEGIVSLHDTVMWIITLITIFVTGLLAYVILRFNAKANPVPNRTTHHTGLEIAWTLIPTLILVFLAIPSFKLLYFLDRTDKPELTVKVVGHQWYWSYEYPDNGNFTFDGRLDPDVKDKSKRLLETDETVVLPVNTNIRLLGSSTDVIHAWVVPALGVQIGNVPGRTNESWVKITRPGTYYGQCFELCGVDHGFMPIKIQAVSKADFDKWVVDAKKKYARVGEPEGATQFALIEGR